MFNGETDRQLVCDHSVTFDKLSMEINNKHSPVDRWALKLGYLQNLHIDYENWFVELTLISVL